MSRKVLFIACFFPPAGGAGVQRALKFVKYLPGYDWSPVVLTVSNPSVPVFDESLLDDVPDTVPVYRARTLEPGYAAKQSVSGAGKDSGRAGGPVAWFKGLMRGTARALLQPDPQILWLPAALGKARQIFRDHRIDAIVATAPPFSSLLLGAWLARSHRLPLVLDYRDEWDISNEVWENKKLGPLSRRVQAAMQSYALRRAGAVTATTAMSTETLAGKLAGLGRQVPSRCIYNGYDHQDIERPAPLPDIPAHRYVLSYVGTLWNLTSIEPVVDAVLRLQESAPDLAANLEIQLAGRCTVEQEAIVARLAGTDISLVRHAYLPHDQAIGMMQQSQGLCLLLSDLDVSRRVVPAKTFEYMTTGNTIFVIAPRGEVWDLLKDYPAALCAEPGDVNALVQHLATDIRRHLSAPGKPGQPFDYSRYERRALTGELAELLTGLAGSDTANNRA